MRIAYLCADPGIPLGGHKGASVHLRSLATALHARGHQLLLAAAAMEGESRLPSSIIVERLPKDGAEANGWLSLHLRDWHPDVVLERYSLSCGPGLTAARQLGTTYTLEVNAPLVDEAARYRGLTNIEAWHHSEKALFSASDRLIAVSNGIRDYLLECGVPRERVAVIHNGVDVALFAAGRGNMIRRRYGLRGKAVVGFAGSLKAWHGVRTLVRAVASLPEIVHLLVVGDGPQREAIEAMAASLHIESRIRMAGAIPHERMPDYLAAMDVAVAPYEFQSSFYFSPLKVMEYMAAGLPVIASDQGDVPEILGGTGVLVAPGDEQALAAAMMRLLTDERRRKELGQRARRRARGHSWDAVAEQVEAVLMARALAA